MSVLSLIKRPLKIVLIGAAGLLLSACSTFNPLEYLRNLDLLAFTRPEQAQPPVYRYRIELARQSFAKGLYGITIAHLEAELAAQPNSVAALNGIGASYDQMGRHEIALQYYFIALSHAPDSAATLANIGYSYLLQERRDEAIALFELALHHDPGNPIAAANLHTARQLSQIAMPAASLTIAH